MGDSHDDVFKGAAAHQEDQEQAHDEDEHTEVVLHHALKEAAAALLVAVRHLALAAVDAPPEAVPSRLLREVGVGEQARDDAEEERRELGHCGRTTNGQPAAMRMRKGVRTKLSDEPAPTQRGALNRLVGLLDRAHIRLYLGVREPLARDLIVAAPQRGAR